MNFISNQSHGAFNKAENEFLIGGLLVEMRLKLMEQVNYYHSPLYLTSLETLWRYNTNNQGVCVLENEN